MPFPSRSGKLLVGGKSPAHFGQSFARSAAIFPCFAAFLFRSSGRVAVRVPAVVGIENNDRVVRESESIECVEDPAETFVHALQHRSHDRIALFARRILFGGELFRVFLLVPPWPVYAVMPEIEEEGPIAICLEELDRFIRQPVRDVFSGRTIGVRLMAAKSIRRKIAGRAGIRMRVDRVFEPVLFRPMRLGQPEMPFADVRGAPPRIAQRLGQRVLRPDRDNSCFPV